MKIWYQHGSEHSANLVMIGHFKDISGATKAKEIIELLTDQISKDLEGDAIRSSERYSDAMLDLLCRLNIAAIGPQELEQFIYEVNVETEENKIILTTEELDISAFLKVIFNLGARIEVYSAHDYSDTGYGRGCRR